MRRSSLSILLVLALLGCKGTTGPKDGEEVPPYPWATQAWRASIRAQLHETRITQNHEGVPRTDEKGLNPEPSGEPVPQVTQDEGHSCRHCPITNYCNYVGFFFFKFFSNRNSKCRRNRCRAVSRAKNIKFTFGSFGKS